jgi:hypothetical protein
LGNVNTNPEAIELLKENPEKLDSIEYFEQLSSNPTSVAISILKANPKKIIYETLCSNTNPEAIKMLEDGINIDSREGWENLSRNPEGIEILKKNQDLINWENASRNKNFIKLIDLA